MLVLFVAAAALLLVPLAVWLLVAQPIFRVAAARPADPADTLDYRRMAVVIDGVRAAVLDLSR